MKTLGINAAFHDSSACLVVDGVVVAAAEEEAARWFDVGRRSPFMRFVERVRPEQLEKIPAAAHVDGTARVQTVNRSQNARLYDLIRAFQARRGIPVLVNTSFNVRGEPIVGTVRDALSTFFTAPIDALVVGPFVLTKPGCA